VLARLHDYVYQMGHLEDLQLLVECESPSHDLDACNRVVDVSVDIANRILKEPAKKVMEMGQPIFWWGSTTPQILLLAHLDTVWSLGSFEPKWSVEGDIARGPGIFDMKAGFIQALYALKDIPDAHNRVALLGTTDEEIESLKSRQVIQSLARTARYALILEPSFEGNVKTRRKGAGMYTVTVHGLAAHAGLDPEKGVNASVEIAALVPKIVALSNPINGTTVTPTVIRSGVTTNTIPDLATLEIDCRSFSSDELVEIDAKIRSFKPENPLTSIVVNGAINRPPLEIGASEVLFEKLSSMTKRLGLEDIGQSAVGGVSDGNLTAAEGTMTLDGLGAVGGGAHAKSEHVMISQIPKRIQILHELLKDLLQEDFE